MILAKLSQFIRDLMGVSRLGAKVELLGAVIRRIERDRIAALRSPIDKYIDQSYQIFEQGHYHRHYTEWRVRRIRKLLDIYGVGWFYGKRILEVGGGLGDIGGFIAALGADVTSVDGRQSNVNFANLQFGQWRGNGQFKSVLMDLEQDFSSLGRFDLVINFGFMEVVSRIDMVMDCCSKMSDEIVLETMVCDYYAKTMIVSIVLDPDGIDDPLHGRSVRPSPAYIEDFFLSRQFEMTRYFDADLNTESHQYDWVHRNDGSVKDGMRRFWRFRKSAK